MEGLGLHAERPGDITRGMTCRCGFGEHTLAAGGVWIGWGRGLVLAIAISR